MTALSFAKLEEAYICVYENAKELLEESRILFDHNKYARSYTLAQIAHEELAKLPIIYQEATRSFFKEGHDWKHFYKRLRGHEFKNKSNFIFNQLMLNLMGSTAMDLEYEKIKDNINFVNHLKNASLYADIKNDRFTKPSIEIKKSLAKALLEMVEHSYDVISSTNFHIKGTMWKSLNSDKAKVKREVFRQMGLIK